MRKIAYIFLCLLSTFFICWGVKARALVKRPSNLNEDVETSWISSYSAPKAQAEWVLDSNIEPNYVPVPGKEDYYYVVDDDGNVIQMRHRIKQIDGSYKWEDVEDENIAGMEVVDKENKIYKTTDSEGNKKYVKYIRNDDNSFAFVDVDKKGNYLNFQTDATTIDKNHILEDSSNNLYGLYNDNGVRIGTVKRVDNKDGTYSWKLVKDSKKKKKVGNDAANKTTSSKKNTDSNQYNESSEQLNDEETDSSQGTITKTSTETYSETKDGYKIMYKVTTTKIYDSNGTLLKSHTSDPEVISKTKITGKDASPDFSDIASTLDQEVTRMSNKVDFNTSKANEILNKLNAQRQKNGVPTLKMDTSSDIYKVALIRAADMAVYNHASNTSPLYGKTIELCDRFDISLVNVTQNMWKTSKVSASEIHTRFQATDSSRETRMSEGYGQVGIAVVDQDGETFVIEVFAQ